MTEKDIERINELYKKSKTARRTDYGGAKRTGRPSQRISGIGTE